MSEYVSYTPPDDLMERKKHELKHINDIQASKLKDAIDKISIKSKPYLRWRD